MTRFFGMLAIEHNSKQHYTILSFFVFYKSPSHKYMHAMINLPHMFSFDSVGVGGGKYIIGVVDHFIY